MAKDTHGAIPVDHGASTCNTMQMVDKFFSSNEMIKMNLIKSGRSGCDSPES